MKKIIIPLIILAFPVVLWLVLVTGHNHFRTLPILGPIDVSAKGDTSYHTIPAFSMINQDGKTITDKDVDHKIYVASFFFASCPSVCPKVNEEMGRVQFAFKDDKKIRMLSFTVDPERDTVPALKEYSQKMRADSSVWWFLTGNKDSIYDLARDGYLVPAAMRTAENDFFHSQDIVLIDKQKRIRGVYDGTDHAEVDSLIDHIKLLMVDPSQK
ncbi:MAG: SCO family protein [Bacteroidia bacterium]